VVEITPTLVVAVALAAFLIGVNKAGIGGSLGPFITVVVVVALPAQTAIALLLPLLIIGDGFAIGALWRRWDTRQLMLLLPGGVAGVAIGTYLLAHLDSPIFARVLGVVTLLFVVYWLLVPRLSGSTGHRPRPWHGALAGTVAGLASALAHSGGPPTAIYLLFQRIEPVAFVATSTLLFTVLNLIKVPAYVSADLFDWNLQLRLAWAVALIPVGVVVGRVLVGRVDPEVFRRVILVLLTIGGTYLLVG
jgi:uncharacterized protein